MSSQDSDRKGSYTEAVGTRLTRGTMERFEDYRDGIGAGNSEALRRLIRAGLDHHDEPGTPRYVSAAMLTTVAAAGIMALLIGTPYTSGPEWLAPLAIGMVGYSAIAFSIFFIKQLAE